MEATRFRKKSWVFFLASMIEWNKRKMVWGIVLPDSTMSWASDSRVASEICPVVLTATEDLEAVVSMMRLEELTIQ